MKSILSEKKDSSRRVAQEEDEVARVGTGMEERNCER
jgi:hypothetical protein